MGNLLPLLEDAGYPPRDIDIIASTHCHPDHIGGVIEGDVCAFPNAKYVMGKTEFEGWKSGNGIPEQRKTDRDLFLEIINPLYEKMTLLYQMKM